MESETTEMGSGSVEELPALVDEKKDKKEEAEEGNGREDGDDEAVRSRDVDGSEPEDMSEKEMKDLLFRIPTQENVEILFDGKRGDRRYASYSLSTNHQAFRSWVKQPSPCCCAASVAGALNTDQVRDRVVKFARRHGIKTDARGAADISALPSTPSWIRHDTFLGLTPFVRDIYLEHSELFHRVKKSGEKKKKKKPTRKEWLDAARSVVRRRQSAGNGDAEESKMSVSTIGGGRSCYDVLNMLFDMLAKTTPEDTKDVEDEGSDGAESDEADEDGDVDDAYGSRNGTTPPAIPPVSTTPSSISTPVAFDVSFAKKKTRRRDGKRCLWTSDLVNVLRKTRGMVNVSQDCARPSTYAFGNWGVLGAVTRLNDVLDGNIVVRARLFAGKRTSSKKKKRATTTTTTTTTKTITTTTTTKRAYVVVKSSDGPKAQLRQWEALRAAFDRPRSCLIFHLKNHYALVYAMRQWIERDGLGEFTIVRRQLLTARKGQRPRHWIDWEETHETLAKWGGYKIILVECERLKGAPTAGGADGPYAGTRTRR